MNNIAQLNTAILIETLFQELEKLFISQTKKINKMMFVLIIIMYSQNYCLSCYTHPIHQN